MRINGINGYIDVDVTEGGHIQVSARQVGQNVDSIAAVRLTDLGAAALSSALDTGGLELESRDDAKEGG